MNEQDEDYEGRGEGEEGRCTSSADEHLQAQATQHHDNAKQCGFVEFAVQPRVTSTPMTQ